MEAAYEEGQARRARGLGNETLTSLGTREAWRKPSQKARKNSKKREGVRRGGLGGVASVEQPVHENMVWSKEVVSDTSAPSTFPASPSSRLAEGRC